ncbi:lipopolysaccharide heptosyltransferase I [Candidatus Thioglobus sp.]|nr:lipopolysaccharide heptosyltransferase I [Candidatus Thioglobus sp.]
MRIAIVKLSALGDIVHAMVVLQFIKKFNKEISIDWIVDESYKDLLELNPDINKVHLINIKQAKKNKSLLALYREFKKVRKLSPYDLVIDMQGLLKSAIVSRLISSSITLGFDKFSVRERFASIFYDKTFQCPYEKNIIERNLALIEYAIGASFNLKLIDYKVPFLYSSKKKLNIPLSESKKNILIIPGASHVSKRYPVSKFVKLTKLIDAIFVVVWGSEDEEILAKKIKENSHNVYICDKLQLDSLILLISRVDLVIGPDTGPTHMAWSLNIPSITLFGSTPGYRNAFETSNNRIIESDSKVNPIKIDKGDYSIKNIDVQEVLSAAEELLG